MVLDWIGIIISVIGIIIALKGDYKCLFIYVFLTSILTTTAVFSIGETSIVVPQIASLLLALRVINDIFKSKIEFEVKNKMFIKYFVFCVVTIIISFIIFKIFKLHMLQNIEVSLVTQIFQLIYLGVSVITATMIGLLISNNKIGFNEFDYALKCTTVLLLLLAFFQKMNQQLFNSLLVTRKGHVIIQTLETGEQRLTATFAEPSMLAIYLSLAITYLLYKNIYSKRTNVFEIIITIGCVIIGFLSRGSTFILMMGLITIVFILMCYKRISRKKLLHFAVIGLVACLALNFMTNNFIFNEINSLVTKLMGKGVSGSDRINSFFNTLSYMWNNPITGMGFGAIRSTDLFSTIVANTGLIGLIGVIKIIYTICKNNYSDTRASAVKVALGITFILLLISVPEPYYNFMWIFIAFAITTSVKQLTGKSDLISEEEGNELAIEPFVHIILVNFNGLADTIACINSVEKINYTNYKIVVVDNASSDESVTMLSELYGDKIKLIGLNENIGFAGGNNVGIKYALEQETDYVLLLNNDTEVEPDFLKELIKTSNSDNEIGAVGGKINYFAEKNKIWFVGGKINSFLGKTEHIGVNEIDNNQYNENIECEYITGCLMLVKRDVLENVGLMPEDYFLYYEETEWCTQIRKKGYKLVVNPKALIYHKVSSSTQKISNIVSYYYDRNSYYFVMNNFGVIQKVFMYTYKRIFLMAKYIRFIQDKEKISYIKSAYRDIKMKEMGKYRD